MPFLKWQNWFDKMQSCQSWKYKSAFIKNECCILFPLVYLVTDMTSQVANLLNVSNVKLELIKQNVSWYVANCFRLYTVNIYLQSFLSSRLSPSHPAVWEYSLSFVWSESDCPLGWGSRLYSFRVMPCLSDNYTIYCLSWSGCDIIAGYVFKRQSKYISIVTFSGSDYMLNLVLIAGLWKNTNVLILFKFLDLAFRFKINFLFVIFSEEVCHRAQRYNPVYCGFAHAQLSPTASMLFRVAVCKNLTHFFITLWHLCLYSMENANFDWEVI